MIQVKPLSATEIIHGFFEMVPELKIVMVCALSYYNNWKVQSAVVQTRSIINSVCIYICGRISVPHIPVVTCLRNLWIFSHFATVFSTLAYSYLEHYQHRLSRNICYLIAAYSITLTYSLCVYRQTVLQVSLRGGSKNINGLSVSSLLRSENTHLLIISILIISSEINVVKIIAFAVYSLVNLSDYFLRERYRYLQFSKVTSPILNSLEDPLLLFAATVDILVCSLYFKDSVLTGNLYQWVIYCLILGLRIESSEYCRVVMRNILEIIILIVERLIPLKEINGITIRKDEKDEEEMDGLTLGNEDIDKINILTTASSYEDRTNDFQYMYDYID